MDCAEGTYGQLVDYCQNKKQVDAVMQKTRAVYITHSHGDHCLGVLRFLNERDKVMAEANERDHSSIFVLVPELLLDWVK